MTDTTLITSCLFLWLTVLALPSGLQCQPTFTHPTDVAVMNAIAANYPTTFGSLPRWVVGTDPCTSGQKNQSDYLQPWSGIQCGIPNATAETYYRVITINLRHYGFKVLKLKGPFPSEIGNLPRVEAVDLSYNALHGTIPNFVSTRLSMLDLSLNNLTGSIPASISNIQTLRFLILERNLLSGPVPPLPPLSRLRLGGNAFTGKIFNFLTNYTNLNTLSLARNLFDGPIPSFPKTTPLNELDLSNNRFSGSIPGSLSLINTLDSIKLSNNRLTGPVPNFRNTTARFIELQCNQLSGTIPNELGALPNLRILRLEVNNLTGILPAFLENSPRSALSPNGNGNYPIYFNASCNFFTPPMPMWCNTPGTNSSACISCEVSERMCYDVFVPYVPNGGGSSSGDGNNSNSPASRPSSFFLSALWFLLVHPFSF